MSLDEIFSKRYNCTYVVMEYGDDQPGLYFGILKASSFKVIKLNAFTRSSSDGFTTCGYVRFTGTYKECAQKFSELSSLKFNKRNYYSVFKFRRKEDKTESLAANRIATSVMEKFERMYGMSVTEWFRSGQPNTSKFTK